jgi:hypothetical protein
MPIVTATWEVEVGGSWYKDSLGYTVKPYLKTTTTKQKQNKYVANKAR